MPSTTRDSGRRSGSPHGRHASARPDVGPAVYRRLRDLIVAGRLAPGAPLIEADLAKRLNASRTPVRAALRQLQQEGFVSPSPVGQALRPIVTPLTASDLTEVFLIVGAFEATAARAAAALPPARRAALVAELRAIVAGLGSAGRTRPQDLPAVHALDGRFHRALAAAGAGPRLTEELSVLFPQAARYVRTYGPITPPALADACAGYRAIAQALLAGRANLAGRRVAAHWRRSLARLRPMVGMIGEQGTW